MHRTFCFNLKLVAPYVGAWIETHCVVKYNIVLVVAPYVGAWIETMKMM